MEAVHHDRENYFVTYIVKKKKKKEKNCLAYADDKNKLLDFKIFIIVTPVTMHSLPLEQSLPNLPYVTQLPIETPPKYIMWPW